MEGCYLKWILVSSENKQHIVLCIKINLLYRASLFYFMQRQDRFTLHNSLSVKQHRSCVVPTLTSLQFHQDLGKAPSFRTRVLATFSAFLVVINPEAMISELLGFKTAQLTWRSNWMAHLLNPVAQNLWMTLRKAIVDLKIGTGCMRDVNVSVE